MNEFMSKIVSAIDHRRIVSALIQLCLWLLNVGKLVNHIIVSSQIDQQIGSTIFIVTVVVLIIQPLGAFHIFLLGKLDQQRIERYASSQAYLKDYLDRTASESYFAVGLLCLSMVSACLQDDKVIRHDSFELPTEQVLIAVVIAAAWVKQSNKYITFFFMAALAGCQVLLHRNKILKDLNQVDVALEKYSLQFAANLVFTACIFLASLRLTKYFVHRASLHCFHEESYCGTLTLSQEM